MLKEKLKLFIHWQYSKFVIAGIVILVVLIALFIINVKKTAENGAIFKPVDPKIVIIDSYIATSTKEFTVIWQISNIPDLPQVQTGLRYDFTSHATTSPLSSTYAKFVFPPKKDSLGNFSATASLEKNKEIFFRVQVQPLHTDEFFWSEEQRIFLMNNERTK